MVPPIRLWDAGVPNRAALRDHDPQLPDARVASPPTSTPSARPA